MKRFLEYMQARENEKKMLDKRRVFLYSIRNIYHMFNSMYVHTQNVHIKCIIHVRFYLITIWNYYFFFITTRGITQSTLLTSVRLGMCIYCIAICTTLYILAALVLIKTFGSFIWRTVQ